ncbi:MAG: hypothetical protein ACI37O_08600 [Candidatus Avelusimicrobium sp.]|uniref:hypothetical protein n=1 Tax=Candidatus Avelusimicrobium sp. TaxID=3048833 RepID=UPI003F07A63B
MADKEERILITKVSSNCHAQRAACDPFDEEEGLFCDKNGQYVRITEKDCAKCKNPVLAGITRAEAVERMARALHYFDTIPTTDEQWQREVIDNVKSLYRNRAEAALDALLGGKNG